ncbi:MAG TPA: hypothetical protein VFA70_02675, partial [Dehalococcoidia bacterium]|nr:hypothetical protein [Dehalococcoidia bacterium]
HMRVDPDWQRHGVGRALSRWLADRWRAEGVESGGSYAFIDARNTSSLAFAAAGVGPGPWPVDAWLQELPSTTPDSTPLPEPLRSDELDDAIALINRTHAGLELFPGYTRTTLVQRLSRSPAYGLQHWYAVRAGGRLLAVAGVCDVGAGLATCVCDRTTGEKAVSRSLALLDYGFADGDAAAMASLLDGLRGLAASCGRQALELSVPECSPLFTLAGDRASDVIRFKFLGGNPRPEPDYPLRGVYIDPVYL